MTDRRTTLEQILVEYGGGDTRRVTLEQILVEYIEYGERRVTLEQILVEWVDVQDQAVSQFGVYVEYRVPDEETGTQIRGWDQIQPGSVMPDRFSPDVAGDGLGGGGEAGPLYADVRDPIFWPPTAQGQAVVSNAAVPPAWTASLTPTWRGEHTFNAGLAVPAAQAITMGDEAYIGCGPADVRIVFDAGNDISLMGGNVGVNQAVPLDPFHVTGASRFQILVSGTAFVIDVNKAGLVGDAGDIVWLLPDTGGTRWATCGVRGIVETAGVGAVTGSLSFTTGGNIIGTGERIRILDTGFVGIACSPSTKFEVSGTAGVNNPEIAITGPASGTPVLTFLGAISGATEPIIAYESSGALRIGTVTGVAAAGWSEGVRIDSSGQVGIGTGSNVDRLLHAEIADAATNSVTDAQRLTHVTSNTAVAGFGVGLEFELEENDASNKVAAIIEVKWSDAGEGVNADAYFDFLTMLDDGAAASRMVVGYEGTRVGIGTSTPQRRLDLSDAAGGMTFGDNVVTNNERGIYWHSGAGTAGYAIFRPAGAWSAPSYVPLNITWQTGIRIDPGASASPGSYVYIPQGGLVIGAAAQPPAVGALIQGNVGINTPAPQANLHVTSEAIFGAGNNAAGVSLSNSTLTQVQSSVLNLQGFGAQNEWIGFSFYYDGAWKPVTTNAFQLYHSGTNLIIYGDASLTANVGYTPTARFTIQAAGNVGVNTITPDRLFHAEVADGDTASTIYAQRLTHITSGTAAALFGVGLEMELEDAGGTNRVASMFDTLWADPAAATYTSLLRWQNTHIGAQGGYGGFIALNNVAGVAMPVVPNGARDVAVLLTVLYAVSESAGGTSGGSATVLNNSSVVLYTDGVDTLTLAVAADGSVTLQRTAGAATFDVSMWMAWL